MRDAVKQTVLRHALFFSVAGLLLLAGCGEDTPPAPEPSQPSPWQPGTPGNQGPDDVGLAGKGNLEVTVAEKGTGAPLAGSWLITDPASTSVQTDANGRATFKDLAAGYYRAVAVLKGFKNGSSSAIPVGNAQTSKLGVEMQSGEPEGPAVTVSSVKLQAGYGRPVSVTATAVDASDGNKVSYNWTQTGGPKVKLGDDKSGTLSFTTAALAAAYGKLPGRPGVLAINPDQAGSYSFKLAIHTHAGKKTEVTAKVSSTSPTTGLGNVPIGVPVYLNGKAEAAAYSWRLTGSPPASKVALAEETTRNPTFVPDKEGKYVVTEGVSGKAVEIFAGTWVGVDQGFCSSCHNDTIAPNKLAPWSQTAHASKFARELDGGTDPATSKYSAACISCHTVGYDLSARNGGFDDVARAKDWAFPAKLQKGNWESMQASYPEVARLANIQCENCHGPQGSEAHAKNTQRVSFSADVCASCHQSGEHHYLPSLLAKSGHSEVELAEEEASFEKRKTSAAHCGRCHSAQGFSLYTEQLARGTDPSKNLLKPDGSAADEAYLRKHGLELASIQPITCAACHDPHSSANPHQLRVFDKAKLAAGFSVTGAGAGALCMQCHNTRNGARGDAVGEPANYGAPHVAAQSDVFYGKNAYFVSGTNTSKHAAVAETCVGCHVNSKPSFLTEAQTSNHTFKADSSICKSCHGGGVNGEGLAASIEHELEGLAEKLGETLLAKIRAQPSVAVRAWDPATDFYSSTAPTGQTPPSNVIITAKPTALEPAEIHGQQGYVMTLPAAMTFSVDDGQGKLKSITTDKVSFQLGALTLADGKTPLVAKNDPIVKAGWNYFLLHGDGSDGVHNPSFYLKVLDATKAALPAAPKPTVP